MDDDVAVLRFFGNSARSLLVGTASTSERERESWRAISDTDLRRDEIKARSEEIREEEISPCLLCGSKLLRTLLSPSAVRGGGKVGKEKRGALRISVGDSEK